ncbi:BamA/TamA family outer membrane protein [Odoribacter sp. OttesenSCG-928-J03]|nr:BamA/TamA family outer membrane protein [Odoribacter sp. OttesenSCG-928-J03]MDL2283387.1 BamA/TamA family outer membrane protein [Odoribacter sp. OttesenSCG-928-G04]
MIKRVFLFFILAFTFGLCLSAQTTDSLSEPEVYYSSPKTYKIAGIEVTGLADHYDPETIIGLARLSVGMEIKIPGDELTRAIKRLYSNGLFSDITISVDRIVGNSAYLGLSMKERQKLSVINYVGFKKSEISKIKEKINPAPGIQVTDNMMSNMKRIIEKQLKEKGFYNTEVKIFKRDDHEKDNFVILDVIAERNNKIKISHVYINGNEHVRDGALKRSMKKTKEKSLVNFFRSSNYIEENFDDDKYNLLDKYNEKGYRDAIILSDSIVQVSPKRIDLYVNVEEGNKYYFNNITWLGNTIYDTEFLSRVLNIKKGDVYNKKYFTERLTGDENSAVDKLYVNNGYLFYRAMPVETIAGKDSINVEIRMIEGPQATINRVIIRGNDRTHEHVARRELYVYPGELFSREDIVRSIRELANLGHFEPEEIRPIPEPNFETGTADVIFELKEKANDKIELSGGWGAGMIIGSLGLTFTNFSIRNIFNWDSYRPLPQGDGQSLSLKAQTNGKYYTSFSLSFREPWLGGRKANSLSVSTYYSRQTGYSSSYNHSQYYNNMSEMYNSNQLMTNFGVSVGLGRRLKWPDDYFTMYNEISYQLYHLKNWPYYIISNGSSNNISFTTSIRRSSIDNPLYTRKGSDVTLSLALTLPYSLFDNVEYDRASIKDETRYKWIEYHKWKFIGKIYMPLDAKEKLILYGGIQYGYLGYYNKNKRSPFEGFEMGGDGMSGYSLYGREYIGLRGYQNGSLTNAGSNFTATNTVDASLYSKWTMELRYPISLAQSATIYVLSFFEAGNSWAELKDFDPFNLYRSAGVGVRIFLPMFGLLGFDWGYGFDEIPGRSGSAGGRFHFILGQEF